jgi:hypothetical protein
LRNFGNADLKIRLYRRLKDYRDDLQTKANQNNFSRVKLVMQDLLNIAMQKNLLGPGITEVFQLPGDVALEKFDLAYQHLLEYCYPYGKTK